MRRFDAPASCNMEGKLAKDGRPVCAGRELEMETLPEGARPYVVPVRHDKRARARVEVISAMPDPLRPGMRSDRSLAAMQSGSARQFVLEAGKSNALRTEFDRLRSATAASGEPKFALRTCNELATAVTCRNHGPLMLQLCHFVSLAQRLADEESYLLQLMPVEVVSGRYFRSFYSARLGDSTRLGNPVTSPVSDPLSTPQSNLSLQQSGVEVRYPDGHYCVHFSRMPVLTALFELCANVLDFASIDDVLREMAEDGGSNQKVSSASSKLSAMLYQYLKDHLPTAQEHRKHRHLLHFMEKRCHGDFRADDIDDEAVLGFWCDEPLSENPFNTEFRLFRTVFVSFVLLRRIHEHGRSLYAMQHPDSIGPNGEQGEVDPGAFMGGGIIASDEELDAATPLHLRGSTIQRIVERIDGGGGLLDLLSEPPLCRVKFLNDTERKSLELLLECDGEVAALPRSFMRAQAFHSTQLGVGRTKGASRAKLIGCGPSASYDDLLAGFGKLSKHLERVMLASAYILRKNGEGPGTQSEGVEDLARYKQAREAFRKLSRAGFQSEHVEDPEILEAFELASGPLVAIRDGLARHMGELARATNWSQLWEGDRALFAGQFTRMYDGADPHEIGDER